MNRMLHFRSYIFLFCSISLSGLQPLRAEKVSTQQKPKVTISTMDNAEISPEIDSSVSLKQQAYDAVKINEHVTLPTEKNITDATSQSITSPHLYVTSAPQEATVTLNNKEIGKTPTVANPGTGTCRISLSLPGYQPYATDIMVTKRLSDTLAVVMIPESNEMRSSIGSASRKTGILRYSLGGISVVSAIVGIVSMVNTRNAYDEWHSTASEMDDVEKYFEREKEFHKHLNVSAVSMVMALCCGTGVVLTFIF